MRQISDEDADAMHAVYGDAGAMRWVDDGRPLDRSGCIAWIEVTRRNYDERGYGMFALEEEGEVVGFCGLVHPGDQKTPEIKYTLLRERWGQGLATEAVRGTLAHADEVLDLPRVIATVAPENAASHRVLAKAGMSHLETRHNEDGSATDVYVWATDRREEI